MPIENTRTVIIEKKRTLKQLLAQQWEKSGLLQGLSDANKRQYNNLALLLESQASQLIREEFNRPPIFISSRGFDKKKNIFIKIKNYFISIWYKIFRKKKEEPIGFNTAAFPIVRRVAAQTIGFDLVSVQPLAQPTGMLFFLDKKEHENAFTKKVLIEKHKSYKRVFSDADYFFPKRERFL